VEYRRRPDSIETEFWGAVLARYWLIGAPADALFRERGRGTIGGPRAIESVLLVALADAAGRAAGSADDRLIAGEIVRSLYSSRSIDAYVDAIRVAGSVG
jgi:hypothetical protein